MEFFSNLAAWATVLASAYWAYTFMERRVGPGLKAEIPTLLVVMAVMSVYALAAA